MAATPEDKPRKSVLQLQKRFKPKLPEWGLEGARLRLLGIVEVNWLAGEAGLDVTHFRAEHRKHLNALDWLLSHNLITSTGTRYELKFLGFCALLVAGNGNAAKLCAIMERVHKLAMEFMKERPIVLQRTLATVANDVLRDGDGNSLIPVLKLMQEAGIGVNYSPGAQMEFTFSDGIYRHANVAAAVWHHMAGYPFAPGRIFGDRIVSMPFDMQRLEVAQDAHSSALKAIERLNAHPDSAISAARAALEATFKHILGGDLLVSTDLPKQMKSCRDHLRLDGEFEDLGRGIVSTALAVGNVRNKFGDAHGKGPHDRAPTRAEARLAVGAALLLCDFLLDRWDAVQSQPRQTT